MIRCNLAILLAERSTKITKVSEDTGISRTTLTSLCNNSSKGIQFETLNTICKYLLITPNDLISYIPIDIEVKSVHVNDTLLDVNLEITNYLKSTNCSLTGYCYVTYNSGKDHCAYDGDKIDYMDISVELYDEELNNYDKDIVEENRIIINAFKHLDTPFRNDIQNKIIDGIFDCFNDYIVDGITFSFDWDNRLFP